MCPARRPHDLAGSRGPPALAAAGQIRLAIALRIAAVLVAIATILLVLQPIRSLARDTRKIAQGNLEHRVEWTSRDSFGVIAAELNRIAVRLRDLRESEAGRRQMEFQLSDAVLQSIFEPIIVTDGKGHLLKVNQAAAELLGEGATDRMALTNTPGGDKILSRHPRCHRHAESRGRRRRSGHASHALRQSRSAASASAPRPCATPKDGCWARSPHSKTSPACRTLIASRPSSSPWPAASCAIPLLQLRRGLYALSQGFAGELTPLQAELISPPAVEDSQKLDDLMADLIEVAEIDIGKRELTLENLRPLRHACAKREDRYCDQAAEKQINIEISASRTCPSCTPTAVPSASILDNLLTNAAALHA